MGVCRRARAARAVVTPSCGPILLPEDTRGLVRAQRACRRGAAGGHGNGRTSGPHPRSLAPGLRAPGPGQGGTALEATVTSLACCWGPHKGSSSSTESVSGACGHWRGDLCGSRGVRHHTRKPPKRPDGPWVLSGSRTGDQVLCGGGPCEGWMGGCERGAGVPSRDGARRHQASALGGDALGWAWVPHQRSPGLWAGSCQQNP